MAGLRERIIPWGGKDYACTPTMRILQRCEVRDFSLSRFLDKYGTGDPEIGMTCMLLSEVLTAAGANDATEEAIYDMLMSGKGWDDVVLPIVEALAPSVDPKKPDAQPAG
ncbi:MAG: hypothetical protein MJH10_10030 [Epibacterium sp.]|nr:hypothetical protein [Epibacterium sp.]NQX73875.1 hypothetical protein [Epibacterium sp.]